MSTEEKNHSTGPRTEEGKAISSMNALKHGLTAITVLLPGEDPAAYQALYDGTFRDFEPINTTETALLQELIDLQWRLRRASGFEARVLSSDAPDIKALNSMSLIAARMKRQYSTTLKEFQELHRENAKDRSSLQEDAMTLHKADRYLNRPSTVALWGFDFTTDDLDWHYDFEKALAEAKEAVENHEYELDDLDDESDDDSDDDLDLAA